MRSIVADRIASKVQKKVFETVHGGKPINSYEPWEKSGSQLTADGQLLVNDLCYGDRYPQSFFDIRNPASDSGLFPRRRLSVW